MANNIVHFEIYADDLARAEKFYTSAFGWAFNYIKEMDYTLVYPGGEIMNGPATVGVNGGMLLRRNPAPKDEKAAPNAFVCTIAVEDIDITIEKIEANGGRVDMPVDTIPGIGKMAYIRDTEMNLVGLLQPIM